jgi:hypothetical protein
VDLRVDRLEAFNQDHEDMWSAILNAQLDEFSFFPALHEKLEYPFSEL